MSAPQGEPGCERVDGPCISLVIEGRSRDQGAFSVRRSLPAAQRRMVGPFIFFDHFGPVTLAPGRGGVDVRPHPHIALATISYLFEGEILHRDSLGNEQIIRPGEVNWMSAGRGIVHSERTRPEAQAQGMSLHGVQTWVALPHELEESEPSFEHHAAPALPAIELPGASLRVVAGEAYGERSPVKVAWPTLYVHARLGAGVSMPVDDTHEERAFYVADGEVECDGRVFSVGSMVVLTPRARVSVCARSEAHVMLAGGAPMDGPRHIYWNFVSSSRERLERAKADWREGRFGRVPGDEIEFIPLPE